MLIKYDISKKTFSFERVRKRALADDIYNWNMTSVMALHSVTSFLRLKDITNTCKCMQHSPTFGGNSSTKGGKLEEAEDFKWVFIVYCVLESK